MRRAIVTGTATVSGVVLLLGLKPHDDTPTAGKGTLSISSSDQSSQSNLSAQSGGQSGQSGQSGNQGSGTTSTPKSPGSSTPGSGTSTTAGSSGTKSVTGDAVDTRYGPVQVAITYSGKKITKIDVVEYPTESGRDREINSYAIPQLNQEAMAAQSANIDGVSGATYTAEGYQRSLQSALDKAGL